MKHTLNFSGEKIIDLAKAQSALYSLHNPETSPIIIGNNKSLLDAVTASAFFNLCLHIYPFTEGILLNDIDNNELHVEISSKVKGDSGLILLHSGEKYVAFSILSDYYQFHDNPKAQNYFSRMAKESINQFIELLA